MENVRVKRAGYAFRQLYLQFLYRYKMLAGPTWPRWAGKPQDGVKILMQVQGVPEDEYAFGKTKLFIRNPKTVSCTMLLWWRIAKLPTLFTLSQSFINCKRRKYHCGFNFSMFTNCDKIVRFLTSLIPFSLSAFKKICFQLNLNPRWKLHM